MKDEIKLLGATLLHTRYGHWQHPQSGRWFIRPVRDHFRNYPGLAEELRAIRERTLHHEHTIYDQQRIQWLSQAVFGTLDIYQQNITIRSVSQEAILEDVEEWLAAQDDTLVANLFAGVMTGDTGASHPV